MGERRDQGPTWLVEGKNRMIYFSDMDGGFGGNLEVQVDHGIGPPGRVCLINPFAVLYKKSDPPTPCHLVVQRYSRRVQYETELGQ